MSGSASPPQPLIDAHAFLKSYDSAILSSTHQKDAVSFLTSTPSYTRSSLRRHIQQISTSSTRTQLGICSPSAPSAISALKAWAKALDLPKGLLHGLDVNGEPVDVNGWSGAYAKYSSGGAQTFEELRRMGLGFGGLWRPGDAVLEEYDGGYRGVYLSVQTEVGWGQFGVLPLDLWSDDNAGG